MSDADLSEVPKGAAFFPQIPADLGVDPLLLAVVHATVFLAGSTEEVVDAAAAEEALGALTGYLQRLQGDRLRGVREDMVCLTAYARQQKWAKQMVRALQTFLDDCGIGTEENA
jgi:hypothetical protein